MPTVLSVLGTIAEFIVAESFWVCTGGVVGFAGLFLGASADKALGIRRSQGASQAFSMLTMLTVPGCALVSFFAATGCWVAGLDRMTRMMICSVVNLTMLVVLFSVASGCFERRDPGHNRSSP